MACYHGLHCYLAELNCLYIYIYIHNIIYLSIYNIDIYIYKHVYLFIVSDELTLLIQKYFYW